MLKRVVAALIIGLCAVSAVDALSVNSYRDEKNEEMRKIDKSYLAGVRDGIVAVDHAIALEGKKPYFCLPDDPNLRLNKLKRFCCRKERNPVPLNTWPFGLSYLRD
jgi:hypothetical protein